MKEQIQKKLNDSKVCLLYTSHLPLRPNLKDWNMMTLNKKWMRLMVLVGCAALTDVYKRQELGSKMGLSRVQLYRKIKALTNYSPNELVRIARLKKAASFLASSEKTISEITYEVGFTSPSYFTKCYKEYFGESPTDFLKRRG